MRPIYIPAILAAALGAMGQGPESVKARFEAIVKAQAEASDRYHDGLAAGKTREAMQPAIDRYLVDVHKNAEAVLELVEANPKDPVVVESLLFVIKTARGTEGRVVSGDGDPRTRPCP